MRADEVCRLRPHDICFEDDVRLSDFHSSRAGCVVRDAKTGKNQFVPLSDLTLLRRLKRFVNSLKPNSTTLFRFSYARLSAVFQDALSHFSLTRHGYRLHSLRHGGATFEWLHKTPLEDVMMKGRWESDKSCKRYLNAGKALLVRTSLSQTSTALIERFASRWGAKQ